MKKLVVLLLFGIIAWGCSDKFDDSELWNNLNDLENRVERLEELCKQLNTNISSLKTIVDALNQSDFITDVTPIYKDGEEIGYTITFLKNSPITIYYGKNGEDGLDGKDGSTPSIGVKKDIDGIYYWTLNGEWMTDAIGNKIRANGLNGNNGSNGTDGTDGITPKLKIENGHWYVSYDNGKLWTDVGQATGDKGDTGSAFYKDVNITDDSIIFTLANNTELALPRRTSLAIFVTGYTEANPIYIAPGGVARYGYKLTGATSKTTVEFIAQDGYKVSIEKKDYSSGTIEITAPKENACDSRIIALVSDGLGQVIMKTLNILEGVFIVESDKNIIVNFERRYSPKLINITSNADWYTTTPELNSSWLKDYQNGTFDISENTTGLSRTAEITIYSSIHGIAPIVVALTQTPANKVELVNVETPGTLSTLYSEEKKKEIVSWKINGSLNESDYAFINSLPNLKALDLTDVLTTEIPMKFNISTLETVLLPARLTVIRDSLFWKTNLKNITIPEGVTEIGNSAFRGELGIGGARSLSIKKFPSSLRKIDDYAFYCCNLSSGIQFPNELEEIGDYAFYRSGLKGKPNTSYVLKIPNKVKSIGDYAFADGGISEGSLVFGTELSVIGKYAFKNGVALTGVLFIPDNVTEIKEGAFYYCNHFNTLVFGNNVKKIGAQAFAYTCLVKVYCYPRTPPTLGMGVFSNADRKCLVVPKGTLDYYAGLWPRFTQYEEFNS